MKAAFILLLSLAVLAGAADQKPQAAGEVKKLGSVTWNLDTQKLVWTVQKGTMVDGKFVAGSEERYEISPDHAVMASADEQRGLEEEEAAELQHLLDVLSLYCAQSVVWWDHGQQESRPAPEVKPDKTAPKAPEKTPPARVGRASGHDAALVALAAFQGARYR
ncbi:MAG: hypothetical protein LAP87_09090 [Acidobacteriia bacterium]|nr:hypothetical protein [Terriglobia bacterium]